MAAVRNYLPLGFVKVLDNDELFSKIFHWGLIAYGLSAALSIALTQILTLALLLTWMIRKVSAAGYQQRDRLHESEVLRRFLAPTATWLILAGISAFVGIDSSRAFSEWVKLSLYMTMPIFVFDILLSDSKNSASLGKKLRAYIIAIFVGQSIAAVDTVISSSFGEYLPLRLPGPVTESGQLVLVIPAAFGLFLLLEENYPRLLVAKATTISFSLLPAALGIFIGSILFGWPNSLGLTPTNSRLLGGLLVLGSIAASLLPQKRSSDYSRKFYQVTFILCGALVCAALVLNLKRGPWLGVFLSCAILGSMLSRKLLWSAVVAVPLSLLLPPVQERIANMVTDFTISGGRKNMWALGVDLVQRYPLGLGLKNAEFMRQLDPGIPLTHRHMHNNLLNVAVESGILGVCVYLWWMYLAIAMGFEIWRGKYQKQADKHLAITALSLSCALLGWQVAGLVEYNFGDSEIRFLAFFYIGILLATKELLKDRGKMESEQGKGR